MCGTWIVTGQDKDDNISMKRSVLHGGTGRHRTGGVRYEELSFGSASTEGPRLTQSPGRPPAREPDRIWTAGVNWFVMPHVKVVANAIHESFTDAQRTPKPGETSFWSGVLRLQFVF